MEYSANPTPKNRVICCDSTCTETSENFRQFPSKIEHPSEAVGGEFARRTARLGNATKAIGAVAPRWLASYASSPPL